MTVDELVNRAFRTARDHGWHEKERNIGELVALMHSELSEALEEHRNGRMLVYYVNGKPEGFGIELADCVIRIADTCGLLGIDLDDCIAKKMAFNDTREYRHGGKIA